jgi:hypothetical protein
MKNLLMGIVAACALAGCATDQTTAASEPMAREYPTGSNIPRKRPADSTEGVSTYDKEALERARQQMPQAPRPGLGNTGG